MNRDTLPVLFLAALLVTPLMALDSSAQGNTQTVTWSQSSQTGMTGWSGPTYFCVTNHRTLYNSNQPLEMAWTDTTGAIVGAVRVELAMNWQYIYNPPMQYTVSINGVQQPGTLTPTTNTPNNCSNVTLWETEYEPGITTFNPLGNNTLTLQPNSTGYASLNLASTFMAQIVVTQLNLPPADPTNLGQIGADGKGIGVGGVAVGGNVTLRATVTDPDFDDCFLEAEVQAPTVFFPGTPNYVGSPSASGTFATVDLTGLPEGAYHWRIRSVDEFDVRTAWVSFGGNSEIVGDFLVNNNFAPPKPLDGTNHGGGDCTISAGAMSGALFPALFGAALLAFGLRRRRA
jgi:hypothetical protein